MNQTWLRVSVVLLAAALAAPSFAQDAEELEREMGSAYEAKDYKTAARLLERLIEKDAAPRHFYNLACVQALDGNKDAALTALKRAAEVGFDDDALAATDPDLKSLRDEPLYKEALAKVQENSRASVERIKKKAQSVVIETFVPSGVDPEKPSPLIVALHGFGGNAREMLARLKQPAERVGAIVASVQGLNKARDGFEWGGLRVAEITIDTAIEQLTKKYKIDQKRIVLVGFSQGGTMASAIGIARHRDVCGVLPIACGAVDVAQGVAKAKISKGAALPKFFLMVGTEDYVLEPMRKLAEDLKNSGFKHEIKEYAGVGHSLPQNSDDELAAGLKFLLLN